MMRACLEPGCPTLVGRGRCRRHTPTTTQRGYGGAHQMARGGLEATLPAPCGYCGVTVRLGERWDAAHVVDGDPTAGYMVAHPRCNQRAKVRDAGREGGGVASKDATHPALTSASALFHSGRTCQARTGGQ